MLGIVSAGIFANNSWMLDAIILATWETFYMVAISTALSYLFGLPLGVILVTTGDGHILESKGFNRIRHHCQCSPFHTLYNISHPGNPTYPLDSGHLYRYYCLNRPPYSWLPSLL